MATDIALARKQKIFAKIETSMGTLIFPVATDYIVGNGRADVTQDVPFADSPEKVDTRDVLDRIEPGFIGPGDWSIPCLLRTAGAGSVPMADALFKALQGTKAVNAGVSVVYSQGTKPSVSIWIQEDHQVKFASGCSVDKLTITPDDKEVALVFSGKCMKRGFCGTGALSAPELAGQTVVSVADATVFAKGVGCKVWNKTQDDDNEGSGYSLAAVDLDNETITISPAVPVGGWDQDDVIAPWLPDGTKIGMIVPGRQIAMKFDGTAITVSKLAAEINDPAAMMDKEDNTSGYTEEFIDGDNRNIALSPDVLFRKDKAPLFYDAYAGTAKAFEAVLGATVGKRLKISCPKCFLEMPKPEEDGPSIKLPLKLKAYGTLGEDSCSLTFY